MKKKKKSLFDVESVAIPEYHSRRKSEAEEEEPEQTPHSAKHHLHWKSGSTAMPEVEVEDEPD